MSNKILISTIIVTISLIITRLLGLIRESVLAAIYGASAISDAFITAFNIPNTVLACVGTSIATVYVSLYYENKNDINRFTSNIINTLSLLGIILTLLFVLLPNILVSLFVSGFESQTYQLTTKFTQIMVLATIPILLFNLQKAYLQVNKSFFLANILDALINIFVIIGIIISESTEKLNIMAYAAVLGNFICFIGLITTCRQKGFSYKVYFNFADPKLKKLLYLTLPVFLSTAVAELNTIIDRNFASTLAEGTISAMNYANKVNGILYSFLSTSLVTVLYPELVEFVANNKTDEIKKYLRKSIVILCYIILPLSIFIFITSELIVKILFQRGSFAIDDTVRTAQCIKMYSIGYLATNINPLLSRFFYAYNNTKVPTINSILAILINIILNFILIIPYKHSGLAFSTSIASIVTTILLLNKLNKKLKGLDLKSIIPDIIKIVIACILLSFIVYNANKIIDCRNSLSSSLIKLTALTILGGGSYLLCTMFMRINAINISKSIRNHNNYGQ